MKKKVAILFVVERGYIEQQAMLLINSIFRFYQGKNFSVDIFTFSPRENFKPSHAVLDFLSQKVTHHFNDNLNTKFVEFPLINGHIGASFFETQFPEYEDVMLLDSDTVFLNDFEFMMESENSGLFLTPVDNKGVGTLGRSDKNHEFWEKLYNFLSIDKPKKTITTTVSQDQIWPYYNAGFVYAKRVKGFFSQWLNTFESIYNSNIRSVYSGKNGSKSIYLEQVALALTAQKHKDQITLLPNSINYPIPFHPRLKQRAEALSFSDLTHIHYHRWFQHPGFLDHVTSDEEKKTEQYRWLVKQLPLQPTIDETFKC
ncbi:glycosyltransferase family protein [Marinicella gelatinilytica]|uniref:hypothetical protein n=1 Tax=Marinicella gelatinilytica TaxID=2996017 RepID=UPI002260AC1A|nr:hypothetical protein [Marinicella gelatinilytica]MCX7545258.1 hypothetical protein [Marinicella gelatinilytica]